MTEEQITNALRNIRADMSAQRLLIDAMLSGLTRAEREALQKQYRRLSEAMLSAALVHAQDDETVHVLQRAVDHVIANLGEPG